MNSNNLKLNTAMGAHKLNNLAASLSLNNTMMDFLNNLKEFSVIRNTYIFYTLGDLLGKPNNKTPAALAIKSGCDIVNLNTFSRDGDFKQSIRPIMPFAHQLGQVCTFLGKNVAYKDFLDRFIARNMFEKGQVILFHPYTFPKAAKAYKEAGKTIVNIGTSAYGASVLDLYDEEYKLLGLNKKYDRTKVISGIKYSDYIIAYSEWAKQSYIKEGIHAQNIFVCHPGIKLNNNYTPKPESIFTFLAVSDFDVLKGFQYLVKAWAKLNLKNARLVIIGKQKDNNPLFEKYKNHPTIDLVGHTSAEPYYRMANVLIHPSLTEGFEKVTMEAMSHNMPVIVTPNCGASNVITDGKEGFIVPIRDVDALKEKILFCYNNPDKVKQMGVDAKKASKIFDLELFSSRIRAIIKKIDAKELIKGNRNGTYY